MPHLASDPVTPCTKLCCTWVWCKVWQGLVQGAAKNWYKVRQGYVLHVKGFGTRRIRIWYKVRQGFYVVHVTVRGHFGFLCGSSHCVREPPRVFMWFISLCGGVARGFHVVHLTGRGSPGVSIWFTSLCGVTWGFHVVLLTVGGIY